MSGRGRERVSSGLCAQSIEPNLGRASSHNPEIMTSAEVKSQRLNLNFVLPLSEKIISHLCMALSLISFRVNPKTPIDRSSLITLISILHFYSLYIFSFQHM